MTDYSELKRLAEDAIKAQGGDNWIAAGMLFQLFYGSCDPAKILALIAESDALAGLLKRFVDGEHEQDENQAERHMYFTEAQSLLALVSGELEAHTIVPDSAIKAIHAERDQLKAEVAGLRTGYEAYERVNAELKADVGRLTALVGSLVIASGAPLQADLTEFLEALRKDAARYEWLRQARSGYIEVVEWIGPHATGMTGEDLDALLDAAMGKGEQS